MSRESRLPAQRLRQQRDILRYHLLHRQPKKMSASDRWPSSAHRSRKPHLFTMSTCLSAFHGVAYCIASLENDTSMKRWGQFPTIVARNRNARNDRHYTKFQDLLQSMCLGIRPNGIRGYYWAITYARRNLPKVNIFILLQRRATAAITARITTVLLKKLSRTAPTSL